MNTKDEPIGYLGNIFVPWSKLPISLAPDETSIGFVPVYRTAEAADAAVGGHLMAVRLLVEEARGSDEGAGKED